MGKLSEAFSDVFEYLLLFRQMPAEDRPAYDTLRQRIVMLLDKAENRSRQAQIAPADSHLAKFAVVAFTDELILNSTWAYRKEWLANTLQMTYFQEHTAGETFFRNLQALGPQQKEVLEVYYFCLCLGFKGELIGDPPRLMGLRNEILQRLDFHDRFSTSPLTPQAYESRLGEERVTSSPPSYLWALLPVGFLLIVYLIFHLVLEHQTDQIIELVQSVRYSY